jgi:CubicO group peptidase (beta-lactamase class C family)
MNGHLKSREGIAGSFSPQIDALFADYDRGGSPGVNVAVIEAGEVIHRRGYGVANIEDDVPFTAETVMRLGSTSKHLCATCILILENRGLLSLHDDVRRHLPELPDFGSPIRLVHLLTMTSGLRDGLNMLLFAGLGAHNEISRAQIIELARRDSTLMFAPGDDCVYSNTNYALLSAIVERLSGMQIGEFMARELFAPLGMHHTKLVPHMTQTIAHAARGYMPSDGGDYSEGLMLVELSGDGGVVSTLDDMRRWFGNYRSDRCFGPDYRARMEAVYPLNDGRAIDYRLGINVESYRGEAKISHAGGMPGHLCDFVFFPQRDLGIVLFANVFRPPLLDMPDRIADIVLFERSVAAEAAAAIPATTAAEPLGFYASVSDGALIQIARVDGALVCFYLGEAHRLATTDPGVFCSAKRGALIELRGTGERFETLDLVLGCAAPIALGRVEEPRARSGESMHEFAGRFVSDVLQECHSVLAHDGYLEIELESPLRSLVWRTLVPVAGDLFTSVIDGEPSMTNVQVRFERDRTGTVTGFCYYLSRCKCVRFARVEQRRAS